MSFTSNLKNEIIAIDSSDLEMISELAAILNVIAIKKNNIQIVTESVSVAKRVFNLVKRLYGFNCRVTIRKSYRFSQKYTYLLDIDQKNDVIEKDLGLYLKLKQQVPGLFIVADEEMKKAYLRGIFLAVGSLSDPKKTSYHLEFVFSNQKFAQFVLDLLNEFELKAKLLARNKRIMIYIKEAEKISDFLKLIGAGGALFYFEDVRIYRDHKNMTNRLNNCEQANADKVVDSSDRQIEKINSIISAGLYDVLDDKLKIVVDYRLKYVDASLKELTEIISLEADVKLTKSGVYHRLRKIIKMADKIKKIVKN